MSTQGSVKGCKISVLCWGRGEGGLFAYRQVGGLGTCTEWSLVGVTGCPPLCGVSAIIGCHCGRTAALQRDYWDSCWNWAELEMWPTDSLPSDDMHAQYCHARTHSHSQSLPSSNKCKCACVKTFLSVLILYRWKELLHLSKCQVDQLENFLWFFFAQHEVQTNTGAYRSSLCRLCLHVCIVWNVVVCCVFSNPACKPNSP